jgi:hypothetical protein
MKLLRNQAEFEEWKEFNIFDGDEAGQPREFPCYVRLRVKDWHMEYEEAVYLYRSDIEKMLSDMDAEPPLDAGGLAKKSEPRPIEIGILPDELKDALSGRALITQTSARDEP